MSTAPQRLGKYELRERLGRGGMAEVWKAFDMQLQRYVAIKILHADLQNDPEFMTRFVREARVIASLHHPNIVQLHDFQVSRPPELQNTIAYMVMDYVEGTTLAEYIRSTSSAGKFPSVTDIVHIFSSISSAVDYAHQKGMIHRDIKPANILLDKRHTEHSPLGEPILTDFGLAKLLYVSTGTSSGSWQGTALYISPEQVEGHVGNERSDLYSLGVILYEMCTGKLPFGGESASAVLAQHLNAMPPAPSLLNPHISPALSAVILRSLAKDPAARFPSAPLMAAALAEAFGMPVPENLNLPAYSEEILNSPTRHNPLLVDVSPHLALSTPASSTPIGAVTPPSQPATPTGNAQVTPLIAPEVSPIARSGQQVTPLSPPQPVTPLPGTSSPVTPIPVSLPLPVAPPVSTPGGRKRRRSLLIAGIALLVILLAGSGLGGFYWLTHKAAVPIPTKPFIGHAFFASSGLLSVGSSEGIEDEFQISLQNVPNPAPGDSYYAWLLSDIPLITKQNPKPKPVVFFYLGKLGVNSGTVNFLYPGDAQHDDLIATYSRVLITEQSANGTPAQPSLKDHRTWRYYAGLPQAPNPDKRYQTVLSYLRNFLNGGSTLEAIGLHGGIDDQLFKNAEKVLEWAGSARDTWAGTQTDTGFIYRQVARILEYLDGNILAHAEAIPLLADTKQSQYPLLQFGQDKNQGTSYPQRIYNQLGQMLTAPGVTPEMRPIAIQLRKDALNVQNWFMKVYQFAEELFHMTPAQLQQSSALSVLDNLQTQANYAFVGQIDPSTNTVHEGVIQIHDKIQHLAIFDIEPYTSH